MPLSLPQDGYFPLSTASQMVVPAGSVPLATGRWMLQALNTSRRCTGVTQHLNAAEGTRCRRVKAQCSQHSQ